MTLAWWFSVSANSLRLAKNVSWLKCASPNETIIPSALETPLNAIETEAICATVMRILCLFVAQIEKGKHFVVQIEKCKHFLFFGLLYEIGDRTVPALYVPP